MTNQTAHQPSGTSADSGSTRTGSSQAGSAPRKRRSTSLMLGLVMLIAAIFAVVLLSPDQLRELVAPFTGRTTPSATIAVAPPPGSPAPARPSAPESKPSSPTATPAPPRPSTPVVTPSAPAVTPSTPAAPPSAAPASADLQALRGMVADLTARLGDLERTASETRAVDLNNRLTAIDARIAALLEQPVVTPNALADALMETRQAAQAAAQESAQDAATAAAQKAVDQAAQKAAQEATKSAEAAAERAVQEAVQKATAGQQDIAPAVVEMEKRLVALEKMAPAVIAIADIDRRLTTIEKMAPAVAAIADQERRLASLEKTAASASSLGELDRRLSAMEKSTAPLAAMSQTALQGEALALGLLNLRLALDRGAPYADVLSALRVAVAKDAVLVAEIERLAPAAATGAPTIATLRHRLLTLPVVEESRPVADASSPASGAAAEPDTFWDDLWERFGIKVRRLQTNAQAGDQPASGVAGLGAGIERASSRLAADDLAGAIGVIDDDATRRNLSANQQTAIDDWLRDARARLTAETGFATLSRRSLALFSAKVETAPAQTPARTAPSSNATPSAPPVVEPQGADAATPGDDSPGL